MGRRWAWPLARETGMYNRTGLPNCSYPSRTGPAGLPLQRLEQAARGGHQRIELDEANPASRLSRRRDRPEPSQRQMYKWTGHPNCSYPNRSARSVSRSATARPNGPSHGLGVGASVAYSPRRVRRAGSCGPPNFSCRDGARVPE